MYRTWIAIYNIQIGIEQYGGTMAFKRKHIVRCETAPIGADRLQVSIGQGKTCDMTCHDDKCVDEKTCRHEPGVQMQAFLYGLLCGCPERNVHAFLLLGEAYLLYVKIICAEAELKLWGCGGVRGLSTCSDSQLYFRLFTNPSHLRMPYW
jgi:hypothetical protein